VPIAQRRPDFHTTILEKLNEKTIHENTPRMKRSSLRDPNALAPLSGGTRLAKDPRRAATKINAATNAATSFSPLRVCLSSAQAQQMLCEDDPSRKNKLTAFSTLLVDGASATREF
jgi:hypothetical protein